VTAVVLCNLGVRDVILGDTIPKRLPPARETGEKYWKAWAEYAPQLNFPILKPAIDYILQQETQIDEILFIGTDQTKQTEDFHRKKDTLYYANLAQAVLVPRYDDRIKHADCHLIGKTPPRNPTLYDEMFTVYDQLVGRFGETAVDTFYVVISGGIPACNTALLLQGIRYFGSRCQLVYLAEGNPQPIPLGIGQQIMGVMRENSIHQMLDRFDFAAAASLLQEEPSTSPLTLALLAYAQSRLWFDFDGAKKFLTQALQQSQGAMRERLQQEEQSLAALSNPAQQEKALIGEVYHNAIIAWDNHRFVDFLGRAQRFQEAVTAYWVAKLQGTHSDLASLNLDEITRQPNTRQMALTLLQAIQPAAQAENIIPTPLQVSLRKLLEANLDNNDLHTLMFDLGVDHENIPGNTKAAQVREFVADGVRKGYVPELVQLFRQKRPKLDFTPFDNLQQDNSMATIVEKLKRLEILSTLREETIIAHGYTGVSENIILQKYNANAEDRSNKYHPRRDMTTICLEMGIITDNPFRAAQDLIKQAMR
jgi:Effector-associated domain 7